MRSNIFLLMLGLASIVATSPAQANSNHLSGQTSPYLQRAVSQPVDWYPWGADAFQRAKELNRPILLDVGAVWCPWCSLMDRDTYTNTATADYINQHFVSVKVDFDAAPEVGGTIATRPSCAKPACRVASHIFHHARRKALFWCGISTG